MKTGHNPIVLFDGFCNLCAGSVRFILGRDRRAVFRFAPLQGPAAREYLARFGLPSDRLFSLVLVEGGRCYLRSSAVLRILKGLGWPWKALYVFILAPPPLRDAAYDLIVKNRYRLFGRREECLMPTPEIRARFLE